MQRVGRGVVAIAVAAVAVVLVATVATSGHVPLATEGTGGWRVDPRPAQSEGRVSDDDIAPFREAPEDSSLPGEEAISVLGQTAVMVVGVLALWLIGRSLLRMTRRLGEPIEAAPEEHWPEPSTEMVDAVEEGLTGLAAGPVDEVIVACWVRLEEAAEAAGAGRRPTETSAELATRVLDELHAPASAIEDLLDRYRQARYSHHPLDEEDRAVATRALEEIRAAVAGARV